MTRARLIALWFVSLVIALAVLFFVGIDDPEGEQAQYCNNVREGVWPDYEGTYKQECGGKDPPQFNADLTK